MSILRYKMRTTESAPMELCTTTLDVSLAPVHFIAMDLKGKLKLLSQGHHYAPTMIDMLTNYTCCILLYTKEADEIVHVY